MTLANGTFIRPAGGALNNGIRRLLPPGTADLAVAGVKIRTGVPGISRNSNSVATAPLLKMLNGYETEAPSPRVTSKDSGSTETMG
jgi:hypothetical protein